MRSLDKNKRLETFNCTKSITIVRGHRNDGELSLSHKLHQHGYTKVQVLTKQDFQSNR
jgi:hypothetical protein